MSDPTLAAMMRRLNPPAPLMRIVETDLLLTIINHLSLAAKRVVLLECGHRAVTSNAHAVKCKDCHSMLMNGDDLDGYLRERGVR